MGQVRCRRLLLGILVLLLALTPLLAHAQARAGVPELQVFVREGCPHCAHAIVGYIADDALMVGLAVLALSSSRLTERTARGLKLISGAVMVVLALVLLLRPGWLL